jgi:hypothetical protein
MKYMLLICRDEKVELDPEARARIPAAAEAGAKEMDGRGVRVEGNALAAISASKAVRVRDGQALITDGPSPRPRSKSVASTFSTAPILTRRSKSLRSIRSRRLARSR